MKDFTIVVLLINALQIPAFCQVDTVWVRRYDEPTWNFGFDVVADSIGNVYVVGSSDSTGGPNNDIVLIKYNKFGDEQWVSRYDETAQDNGWFVKIAGPNRIVVVGYINSDIILLMYDSDGNEVWKYRYDGPGNDYDLAERVTTNSTGDIYITGRSNSGGNNDDMVTLKFDINGNLVWERRYDGIGNWDWGTAIALSSNEKFVYVTGPTVVSTSPLNYDIITICYRASDGHLIWSNSVDIDLRELSWDLSVDTAGNVFVTGEIGEWQNADYVTIKFDHNGNVEWTKFYNGPANSDDVAFYILTTSSNDIYVLGRSIGDGTGYDICVIKYDSLGNEIWIDRYNGPGNGDEWVWDLYGPLASDTNGNIYITFSSIGAGSGKDYCTICYKPNGEIVWLARYDENGYTDEPFAIFVDDSGYVYVTGYSRIAGFPYGILTIKYSRLTDVEENKYIDALGKPIIVYPNLLLRDDAIIHFDFASELKTHWVNIVIRDICGRKIKKLFEGRIEQPSYDMKIGHLPAGIYFIIVNQAKDKCVFCQKIVKLN